MTRDEAIKILDNEKPCCGEKIAYTEGERSAAYDMAIAALREQPQWISVEDRLPEPDTDVLARRAIGMDVECYHKEASGYWSWDEYSGKWKVTHWMPLPTPPEVEV